jgi:GT2 family glycosyltransferase
VKVSCVVLTTGERPGTLEAALDSVRRQQGVDTELIVVHNVEGRAHPPERDGDVFHLRPGENLGIPGGRNRGAAQASGELLLFLDDDGELAEPRLLERAARAFERDATLAVVTMRIVDPVTGRTERRHVPRLRVGDPTRSSWVTTFLGGASIIRRSAFEEVGGLPDRFFYAHEETSLAWRLLDAGYRLRYDAASVLHHPGAPPARHARYHELTARNRVLLARMHLPLPLAVLYLLVWAILTAARQRGGWAATVRGVVEGYRAPDVARAPIRWRTVARMIRYGRPPLV